MSQKSSSRTKNSERNRSGQQRINNCRVNEQIQEERVGNGVQVYEERQCDCNNPVLEPRYDPEELRDAARKLGPFLRLIEDTNNPYARIIAREVCKTFYHLFHPNMHPIDVIRSVNWNAKSNRTDQLWAEFWLYVQGSSIKSWEPLCAPSDSSDLNFNGLQPINLMDVFNDEGNCVQRGPVLQPRSQFPERDRTRISNTRQNVENIHPPDDNEMFGHQYAGSDLFPNTNNSKSSDQSPPVVKYPKDQNQYTYELDTKHYSNKTSDNKRHLEPFIETVSKQSLIFEDNIEENKMTNFNSEFATKRHAAGYDTPNSNSGCPIDVLPNQTVDQYEYYRITGNSSSSQQTQSYIFRPISNPPSPIDQVEPINNIIISDEECDNEGSANGPEFSNENEIEYNASLVANAFTSVSIATQDLQKKKEAFKTLTQNYLTLISSQNNVNSTPMNSPSAQKVLDTITSNQPKAIRTFIDHELNSNAFKDRDFVRLLPFFESVHNKLEYISKEQRDYGINMLDDIMSTLYHIHYDLGDPRLKSDVLVEHVKLITRNTWELYFYNETNRMPDIPEKPLYTPSPQRMPAIPELPEPSCNTSTSQCVPAIPYQLPPCNSSTSQSSSSIPYQLPPHSPSISSAINYQLPPCNPSTSQISSTIPYQLPPCNPSTSQSSSAIPYQLPPCKPTTSQGSSGMPYQQPSISSSQNMLQQLSPKPPNIRPPSLQQSSQGGIGARSSMNINRNVQAPSKRRQADVTESTVSVPVSQTSMCS